MIGKKKRKVTDPLEPPPRPELIRFPVAALFRMFVIGSIAVIGAVWAIWRHYTVPRAPMIVPAAPAASEIEIEPAP
ncbi:MAG TPA: hypothetical protein VM925_30395 [Labilithrix sp.]|nr:hypothetical protein [Labilithrix sp.]